MRKILDLTPKKAIKIRIYPNKEQEIFLLKTFGCCRKIYNSFLELKQKRLPCPTEANFKKEHPYMFEVDSIALQQSCKILQEASDNYFKSLKGIRKGRKMNRPKFKSKKTESFSYRTVNSYDNIKIDFEKRCIKLPKIDWIKFRDDRIFATKIKSVTVSRDPSHRFYASILIDKIIPEIKISPKKVIGLDMSLKNLAIDSNGDRIDYPRYFRRYEPKLAWEQRKLSRRRKATKDQEASNRYKKQKIKVAKVYAKIADSRRDFLQKLSTQITNEYDVICIESLNMKTMARSLNLGKSVNDVGWGMFSRMLTYKVLWKGRQLIRVSKYFPSSKKCSVCDCINKELTIDDKVWVCPNCNTTHDRDINAAINIKEEGIRLLNEQNTVGTTEIDLLGNEVMQVNAQGDCVRPAYSNLNEISNICGQ